MERTDQPSPSTAPVDTDPQADATELLNRAAEDYAAAQAHRAELSHEDRVHGNEAV